MGKPFRERTAAVGAAYDELFASHTVRRSARALERSELELAFRAAHLTAFVTLDSRHVEDMMSALVELRRHQLAEARHVIDTHQVLIKARRFDEARQLAAASPALELEAIPEIRDDANVVQGQPAVWVVHPTEPVLLRRTFELRDGVKVVVISHPQCHFSAAAAAAIEVDPELRELFRRYAVWLAPQSHRFDLAMLQAWNRDHVGAETILAVNRDEWPIIDSWGTPTFYFLEDGITKEKVRGWPEEGRRDELMAAFRSLGMR